MWPTWKFCEKVPLNTSICGGLAKTIGSQLTLPMLKDCSNLKILGQNFAWVWSCHKFPKLMTFWWWTLFGGMGSSSLTRAQVHWSPLGIWVKEVKFTARPEPWVLTCGWAMIHQDRWEWGRSLFIVYFQPYILNPDFFKNHSSHVATSRGRIWSHSSH